MSITCLAANGQCLMASRVDLFLPVAHAAESNFMFPLQATAKLTQTLTNDWLPCGSIFRKEEENLPHSSTMESNDRDFKRSLLLHGIMLSVVKCARQILCLLMHMFYVHYDDLSVCSPYWFPLAEGHWADWSFTFLYDGKINIHLRIQTLDPLNNKTCYDFV